MLRNLSHATELLRTAMDYLKKIKKIMNQCIAKKWIERGPFIGFKMSVNETHKIFLNEQELLLVAEKQIAIKRWNKSATFFFSAAIQDWRTALSLNSRRLML